MPTTCPLPAHDTTTYAELNSSTDPCLSTIIVILLCRSQTSTSNVMKLTQEPSSLCHLHFWTQMKAILIMIQILNSTKLLTQHSIFSIKAWQSNLHYLSNSNHPTQPSSYILKSETKKTR